MRVRIVGPQQLHGTVKAPRSKAYTHRALVASMLTDGKSTVRDPLISDDTVTTLDGIQDLGARVHESKQGIEVQGIGRPFSPDKPIDCAESGATLRFLTAIATAGHEKIILSTRTGLANRPLEPLLRALTKLGASTTIHQADEALSVTVQGPLKGGDTTISGEISSQFISGLLMTAPFARDAVTVAIEGKLESGPYVDLTIAILEKHGITVEREPGKFRIPAPQKYRPATHHVPCDYSSCAFLATAGATAGDTITLTAVDGDARLEPDSIILQLLPQIGARIERTEDLLTVSKSQLRGFDFEASDYPDLVPVLEVIAAQAEGRSTITGVKRLRFKESDRLTTIPSELARMGARIAISDDMITIEGIDHLAGEKLSSHRDHRLAMAFTVAALAAEGESLVQDAEVVSKSYPAFFNDLEALGANVHVE